MEGDIVKLPRRLPTVLHWEVPNNTSFRSTANNSEADIETATQLYGKRQPAVRDVHPELSDARDAGP